VSKKSLQHRMAAHQRWAKESDRSAATEPARQGLLARFERDVDPERILTAEERARRAENARQAFYLALAAKSVAARRGSR
jgi:hypothetical protein